MSNNMSTNELMFKYIKEKKTTLKEVLLVEIKEEDDEFSASNTSFIVKCIVAEQDTSGTTLKYKDVERTCIVNVIEFNKWQRKEEAIMWI